MGGGIYAVHIARIIGAVDDHFVPRVGDRLPKVPHIEAGAHRQQGIAPTQKVRRELPAHPDRERMAAWKDTQALERGHYRQLRILSQVLERVHTVGVEHTLSGIEQRVFCLQQSIHRGRDIRRIGR